MLQESAHDTITILRCAESLRLAKAIHPDGRVDDYDSPKTFDATEQSVSSLADVYHGLTALQSRRNQCVIRGGLLEGPTVYGIRRLLHKDPKTGHEPTIRETPRAWVSLDLDGLPRPDDVDPSDLKACSRAVLPVLPEAFRRASYIVQATAGHGLKPGNRLRLWFWLNRRVGRSELEVWFRGCPVDPVSFRAAQVIYTASPCFVGTARDPIPSRFIQVDVAGPVDVPSEAFLRPAPARSREWKQATPEQAEKTAMRSFERGLAAIATASEGNRHATTVKWAYSLACFCREGRLNESDVRAGIAAAMVHAGKQASEAELIFNWALLRAGGAG
jgi:hypothetical protein